QRATAPYVVEEEGLEELVTQRKAVPVLRFAALEPRLQLSPQAARQWSPKEAENRVAKTRVAAAALLPPEEVAQQFAVRVRGWLVQWKELREEHQPVSPAVTWHAPAFADPV